MDREKEVQLAKAAYKWLKVSPILTLMTLFIVAGLGLGPTICGHLRLGCDYEDISYVNYLFGVILSALWHLILLQYVNNKDSEFVRGHGRKALTLAGIRTGIALGGLALDWVTGAGGIFVTIAIFILFFMWAVTQSKKWVEDSEAPSVDVTLAPAQLKITNEPTQIDTRENSMSENDKLDPKEVLTHLYEKLQSEDDAAVSSALSELNTLSYSSEAIRRQLEQLATHSDNRKLRKEALTLLGHTPNRTVQQRLNSNKLDRGVRYMILQEISDWVKNSLIENDNADVLRRRYDFDIVAAPQTAPAPVAAKQTVSTPKAESPTPIATPSPKVPPEPRPSLLQTLTSEGSIKVYLYLGAFFVIAAAAILGAVVPELRLPILILGTLIFGGLAVAIKKRLPQPSFTLFIVFSFLLLITSNVIEESLRTSLNLTQTFTSTYWVIALLIMAIIWSGGTWLYESRFFSLTAFGALALSMFRIGDAFNFDPTLYTILTGIAALIGLGGTWLLKKWRDEKFAQPLFLASQLLQIINLASSFLIFGVNTFNTPANPLWNLGHFFAWGLGTIFYLLSNGLFPFFIFPWLAAATLIPMPWFINSAFSLENLGSAIVLFIWGATLAVGSEVFMRFERLKKYSLPVLLASIPGFAMAVFYGFLHETWLGLILAAGVAFLFTVLHVLKNRWWLWTLALFNAIIAYFAFFQLNFIQRFDIFMGYQVAVISILLLLPDLLLKKDWSHSLQWRLPLRIYGALFAALLSLVLLTQDKSGHVAICYALYAVFFAAYAFAYRNALIAYLPAAYLPLALTFALKAFNVDAWLPVLTALAVFYYLIGALLRNNVKWGGVFRNSGLTLGVLISLFALILAKQTGGWYALIIGLLFIAEMFLSKNGWFEIGAPALFTLGIYLILHDLRVEQAVYHLLAYALVWILADLLAHLTFTNPRPLSAIVRVIGAMLAFTNYIFLFIDSNATVATIGFGIYTLLFLTVSLLYRQPNLLYAFTLTLPLFATFLFRIAHVTQWIHPVIVVAMLYYVAATFLTYINRAKDWGETLRYSGLGVGVIVSFAAPILGGLDASIPVALAATLWAFEAFSKRNAWLAFPANALYLMSYFIILSEMNVKEPQFFSMGIALFGLIQHYLLTRTESKSGAFLMGMFSQFVLLGTTYIEIINKGDLNYFFLLFVQSLVILVYGLVIRSRSLTLFPIGFVVLGVVTVVYSALKDVGAIFVIGCTGILLLMLGVGAVLLRERIAKLGEKLSDWRA
ncbi:hypothetical protein MASR2M66_19620 [Chloroflexota bacterium]